LLFVSLTTSAGAERQLGKKERHMSRAPSLGVGLVAAVVVLVGCRNDGTSPSNNDLSPGPALLPGHVAFASDQDGTAHIYVLKSDGTGATALTSGPVADGAPAWSPDGTLIAFGRYGQGIFVVRADGSGLVRLTSDPSDTDPDWSPDGTRIAFARSSAPGLQDIYVMGADGSAVTRLTEDGGNLSPAWSPDGARIAFDHTRNSDDALWQVYTMTRDGNDIRRLTSATAPAQSAEGGPAWSPDGRSIVYWSFFDGVAVIASDGSGASRRLIHDFPGINYWARPRWSPDGKQVLFATGLESLDRRLLVINADGSGLRQVKGMENANAWDVTWVR
jgi:TolB protein